MAEAEDLHLADVVLLGPEDVLALVVDAAAGLQHGRLPDVRLLVAAVDADRVELKVFPGEVLVDRVLAGVLLVQVDQQRGMLVRGDKHLRVAAQRVLTNDVLIERVAVHLAAVEVGGDVQEVVPEVDHHLEQLALGPDLPGDGGVDHLPLRLGALVVELVPLVAQLLHAEFLGGQLGELQLGLARLDLFRGQLGADPGVDALILDVGDDRGRHPEGGPPGQVQDRVLGQHRLHGHLGRRRGRSGAGEGPSTGRRVLLQRLAGPGAHVAFVLLGVGAHRAGLLATGPRRGAVGHRAAGRVASRRPVPEETADLRGHGECRTTGDDSGGAAEGHHRLAPADLANRLVVIVEGGQSGADGPRRS